MLSFNALGNMGRLGNQMFQFAALKGIARRHGYEFCIPPPSRFGTFDKDVVGSHTLFDCFDLSKVRLGVTGFQSVKESTHRFDEVLFETCPDHADLRGYFQTARYSQHIAQELRRDFAFPDALRSRCEAELDRVGRAHGCIAVHVRRGDYLQRPQLHVNQPLEYYAQAIGLLDPHAPVFVFSDDIGWCEAQPLFASARFHFVTGSDTQADLCLMSLCDQHVIANSSFSWWGSWLAGSKRTIAPRSWFGPGFASKDPSDIYMAHWTVLDVEA